MDHSDSRGSTCYTVPIFCFYPYLIPSAGMENSLFEGERILVNNWSYGLRLPFMSLWGYHKWGSGSVDKNDIIVFNNPANFCSLSLIVKKHLLGAAQGFLAIHC